MKADIRPGGAYALYFHDLQTTLWIQESESTGAVKRPMAMWSRSKTRDAPDILAEGNSISSQVWMIRWGAPEGNPCPRISGSRRLRNHFFGSTITPFRYESWVNYPLTLYEAAVRGMMDEVLRVDARRLVGILPSSQGHIWLKSWNL